MERAPAPPWEHAARIAAARHRPPHLDRDDALQIARLAAWQASQRWRPGRGANMLTWCTRRASGALADERRTWARRHLATVPLDRCPEPAAGDDRSERLELDDVAALVSLHARGPREAAQMYAWAVDAA